MNTLKDPALPGGFYATMLSQDFSHLHYAYDMDLEYEGVDPKRGSEIVRCLLRELDRHERTRAGELFPVLVSTVATDHMMYGRCVFELFRDEGADFPGPRLGVLPGWSLRRKRGQYFQALHREGRVEWRQLPATSLVEFRLPGRLGKDLYSVRRRLQVLDAHRPGDLAMVARSRVTGYDFSAHRKLLDEMAARATRRIGWHGRDAYLERATNSYRTYRQLRFRRTWLMIVNATSETLTRVCNHPDVIGDMALQVRVTGVPTIAEIERHADALISGSISLDEIFRSVLHPRR
ncbi:hypothetical protein [Micromonospora sp. MH33]|uniref:hypothetical protein n=1 Tax=Micromonospora sp. MH33 TaxID=1945509 RepID=UPI0011B1D173|nr:hypothetical protein [Micromonospora sp. MH33]